MLQDLVDAHTGTFDAGRLVCGIHEDCRFRRAQQRILWRSTGEWALGCCGARQVRADLSQEQTSCAAADGSFGCGHRHGTSMELMAHLSAATCQVMSTTRAERAAHGCLRSNAVHSADMTLCAV